MTVLPLCGSLVAGAAVAHGSPGEDDQLDGAVFAGVTAPHPGNIVGNPAALLRLPAGVHLFLDGALRFERLDIDRLQLDPATGAASPAGAVAASVPDGGGTAGVVWRRASTAFAASLGWRTADGTIDRDATAYQSKGDRARRLEGTVSFSLNPLRWLDLGLSVGYAWQRRQLGFDRDTALEAGSDPTRGIGSDCGGVACGFEHPLARERWQLDVTPDLFTDNLTYRIGVMAEPARNLWIALATERPWRLDASVYGGTATVTAAPRDGGAVRTGRASIGISQPVIWRLGVRGRIRPGWDALGELRLRQLDRVGGYALHTFGGDLAAGGVPEWYPRPRGLENAWAGWVGLEQVDDGRAARFGFGLGGDTGATRPAALSAMSPWAAEVGATAGAQIRLRPRWTLQLGGQVRYQLPTSTGASAYDPLDRVACVDSGYDRDLPACATVRAGYGLPTAAGDYRRTTLLANLGLRIQLR